MGNIFQNRMGKLDLAENTHKREVMFRMPTEIFPNAYSVRNTL